MLGRSKLLVVYWLGLSIQARVRARDRKRNFILLFFVSILKSDEHRCLALQA